MDAHWALDEVLPHRPPFVLLDGIESWNEAEIVARVEIRESACFLEDAGVPAFVGLEYMAQACGAWAGCSAQAKGETVKVGFLLGSRDYTATRSYFPKGETLRITAKLDFRDDGLGSFRCSVHCGETLYASATVVVYQPQDVTEFM